jgi:uncharacterized protein YndB with AHSA1/START domain
MTVATEDTVLQITRIFDAPPARVFEAWLTREEWQAWIGPEGVNCEVTVFEPRIGGRYRVMMRMSDGRVIPVAGVFKTIEAPRSFTFTWGWEGDDERQSLITITLNDLGGKTELTLRQEGLGTVENRDAHGTGWHSALNKLVRHLAAAEPTDRPARIQARDSNRP